jgi:hypothetical protein
VRPIRDALAAAGFEVFWDQAVPAGIDWDSWIRRHLADARCAVVAWSVHSVASDNVRHEATIARQQDRLVPLLIDALGVDRFPMGLYATQAANLTAWSGGTDDPEWQKLVAAVQAKATPRFVRQMMDALDAELVAERARRETAERRDRTLREQIAKEAQASQELRRELADAREEADEFKARLEAAPPPAAPAPTEAAPAARIAELSEAFRKVDAQRSELASRLDVAERTVAELRQRLAGNATPAAPAVPPPQPARPPAIDFARPSAADAAPIAPAAAPKGAAWLVRHWIWVAAAVAVLIIAIFSLPSAR